MSRVFFSGSEASNHHLVCLSLIWSLSTGPEKMERSPELHLSTRVESGNPESGQVGLWWVLLSELSPVTSLPLKKRRQTHLWFVLRRSSGPPRFSLLVLCNYLNLPEAVCCCWEICLYCFLPEINLSPPPRQNLFRSPDVFFILGN